MEMCPYCGEDAPVDSGQCWKCGSELSGDGMSGGPELVDCPACTAPLPPSANRCGECGWATREQRPRRRVPAAIGAFALVSLGILVGLGFGLVSSRHSGDPGRASPLAFTYENLAEIYGSEDGESPELLALWAKHHRGRFVSWEMVILEVFPDGTLALAPSPVEDDDEPFAVILTLQDPKVIGYRDLKAEKPIKYSAALERYEGRTFFLTSGVVADDDA